VFHFECMVATRTPLMMGAPNTCIDTRCGWSRSSITGCAGTAAGPCVYRDWNFRVGSAGFDTPSANSVTR
jgi:hypothetical protein